MMCGVKPTVGSNPTATASQSGAGDFFRRSGLPRETKRRSSPPETGSGSGASASQGVWATARTPGRTGQAFASRVRQVCLTRLWFAAGVDLIAGRLPLPDVMAHLSARRPVFHSQADLQFAFARSVAAIDDTIRIRLEVPQRAAHSAYVDLTCTADQVSLIELTYVTRRWTGTDGHTDEQFDLRGHEALDLARRDFVRDVTRLERWTDEQPNTNGFAVLLTNDDRLWEPPATAKATRDGAFRLHEGQTFTGDLGWGTAEQPYEANDRVLRGTYTASWGDYSQPAGDVGGTLRWLGWSVTA
jgi:hypothetical protein